jgi:hypothetical protein
MLKEAFQLRVKMKCSYWEKELKYHLNRVRFNYIIVFYSV